jgi:rare lipoprotein A (peptidoglycan hydrolase)
MTALWCVLLLLASSSGIATDRTENVGAGINRGLATWYDAPSKQDAAAGPVLRKALGPGWRGSWVRVTHVSDGTVQTVTVVLSDFCACGPRHGQPTLLDLDDQAFADLAPIGAGVVTVRVEAIDGVPRDPKPTAPSTDTGG